MRVCPRRQSNTLTTSERCLTKESKLANIKSQIKRNITNEKARERNRAVKTEVKSAIRDFREAATAGDKDTALEAQRVAARKLDKAVSKGVLHKNNAANRKSAMAERAKAL